MNSPNTLARAVVLLAHGSRDPLWRGPIEAVAHRMQTLRPQTPVACAYIEHTEPSLDQVAGLLVQQGVTELVVFPMFLGMGKHARADVPLLIASVQQAYPALKVSLLPSAGENPAVIDCLARAALAAD